MSKSPHDNSTPNETAQVMDNNEPLDLVIAHAGSGGINVVNLQHLFLLAAYNFRDQQCGIYDGKMSRCQEIAIYSVIVVLVGTALSQVLGQKWSREESIRNNHTDHKQRVPNLKKLINSYVLDVDLKDRLSKSNRIYDSIRHFGYPKYPDVSCINRKWAYQYFIDVIEVIKQICIEDGYDTLWLNDITPDRIENI